LQPWSNNTALVARPCRTEIRIAGHTPTGSANGVLRGLRAGKVVALDPRQAAKEIAALLVRLVSGDLLSDKNLAK
jgi:hypothetical protein